jgi:hypothetical protein
MSELPVVFRTLFRQLVLDHFGQECTQEQTASVVLNSAAHLDKILQNVLSRGLLGLDIG